MVKSNTKSKYNIYLYIYILSTKSRTAVSVKLHTEMVNGGDAVWAFSEIGILTRQLPFKYLNGRMLNMTWSFFFDPLPNCDAKLAQNWCTLEKTSRESFAKISVKMRFSIEWQKIQQYPNLNNFNLKHQRVKFTTGTTMLTILVFSIIWAKFTFAELIEGRFHA